MKKYRITKYNPFLRDKQGRYALSEWTSYADIGKLYNGEVFEPNEYICVENKYIQVLMMILKDKSIDTLVVKDLEKYFSIAEAVKLLNDSDLSLSKKEEELFETVRNENIISISQVDEMTKLLLRECLWCKLRTQENNLFIQVGYDFYLYIYCENIPRKIISDVSMFQMYIEEMDI
ncbi:hypothetical protein [[Clostridium] fimetarium]|uniref:Uncharacterized protein n=1 Tax=[Clostridium] fimetarium TaxID=99656 RepID=A0A1I0PQ26_9FIRM|nr:hypothetical protein [[Clostridium] fimetarium]SEW16361.1 hypothetical protein SAMN05421659_105242 [[Clostridium] fimetarium]